MALDLGTVIFILGITHLIQVILFYYLYKTNKNYKGIFWWLLWCVAESSAFSFMLLRNSPGWYPAAVALQNSMLIGGTTFLYVGVVRFLERKVNLKILIPILAFFTLSSNYYLFIKDDIHIRAIFIGLTISALAFFSLAELLKNKTDREKTSVRFISAVFILHGLVFLHRSIMIMTGIRISDFFESTYFNLVPFFDALFVSLLLSFSIIIMIYQRLSIDILSAKSELQESESRISLIFENMLEGIAVHEMIYNEKSEPVNYRIIEVNRSFEHITGIESRMACGVLATDLYNEEKAPYIEEYALALRNNHPLSFEAYYENMAKSFAISVVPVKAAYFATIFMDISLNKKLQEESKRSLGISEQSRETLLSILEDQIMVQQSLQESNELLSLFIKNSPIYTYIKEVSPEESRVYKASDNFHEMIGVPGTDMAGKNMFQIFPEGFAEKITADDWNVASSGNIIKLDEELNGRFYNTIKFPIKIGRKTLLAGYTIDITDRRIAEDEIRKLNDTLELRIALRTAQLEASNEELESFTYSVSHDLRAPLRHINGYVDLLVKHNESNLNEKGKQYLKSIIRSTQQMGTLIDDLLHFSRTGRQELHITDIDMNEAVREAMNMLTQDLEGRKIEWTIQKLPQINGDFNLLRQVWTNLLSNAIKFTRTKAEAKIEIGYSNSAKEVEFFIRDNGVGFDMIYAGKLFGVFQRFHPVDEFEGTGIGLANVRRIILKHGGRVRVEAEIDKGAAFYFTLLKN
jgi:signal transduction histidine kinase